MSKNSKSLLPLILKCAAGLFVLLALIFMFVLPGLSYSEESTSLLGTTSSVAFSISFFGLVFGNGTMHSETTLANQTSAADVTISGGMSIFALLAFIFLIAGIVTCALTFVLKDKAKLLGMVSGVLLVLAGICAFMVKVAGTDVVTSASILGSEIASSMSFTEYFKEMNLGIGAILFGVLNILAGGCLLVNEFVLNK